MACSATATASSYWPCAVSVCATERLTEVRATGMVQVTEGGLSAVSADEGEIYLADLDEHASGDLVEVGERGGGPEVGSIA